MQGTFKTGDKAVYPGQGVGEVMGIEHTEVAGQRQSFYVLRILENGMRIMIPINKVGSVGLREIISEDDVRQVYLILKEKAAQFNADAEIQALLAEINADDGSMNEFFGAYSTGKAAALKAREFDRVAIAQRGQPYEKLDQLTIDLLLGAR